MYYQLASSFLTQYRNLIAGFLIVYILTKVIYVLWFGPTANIPGPWHAKLVGFQINRRFINGDYHIFLHELHLAYGPVVEYAPHQISVVSPNGAHKVYSTYKFKKTEYYEFFDFGGQNIFSTRDREVHSQRNKILTRLFSTQNLGRLESIIREDCLPPFFNKLDEMVNQEVDGGKCDIYTLLHRTVFDITGIIGFGKHFQSIKDGAHPVLKWANDGMVYGKYKNRMPVITNFFKNYLGKLGLDRLEEFSKAIIEGRRASGERRNDVLQAFFDADDNEVIDISDQDLVGEMVLQIVAGTETTTSTMTWALRRLLDHPDELEKVQAEIDSNFPDKSVSITSENVKKRCPYLVAFLSESMRFTPVTSGNKPRVVPDGGVEIDGVYVPGGLEITASPYAYHRSPASWKDPDVFDVNRYLDPSADLPTPIHFLIGPRACTGKELAINTMYIILANILHKYSVSWWDKSIPVTEEMVFFLKPKQGAMFIKLDRR